MVIYVPETGSIRITNNKVKQGRDGACRLYQGQIYVMSFVDGVCIKLNKYPKCRALFLKIYINIFS